MFSFRVYLNSQQFWFCQSRNSVIKSHKKITVSRTVAYSDTNVIHFTPNLIMRKTNLFISKLNLFNKRYLLRLTPTLPPPTSLPPEHEAHVTFTNANGNGSMVMTSRRPIELVLRPALNPLRYSRLLSAVCRTGSTSHIHKTCERRECRIVARFTLFTAISARSSIHLIWPKICIDMTSKVFTPFSRFSFGIICIWRNVPTSHQRAYITVAHLKYILLTQNNAKCQ